MLYPLSYEGGDGAEHGAKLGATARKPWGKGSSGSIGRSKVQWRLCFGGRRQRVSRLFSQGFVLWFADLFS